MSHRSCHRVDMTSQPVINGLRVLLAGGLGLISLGCQTASLPPVANPPAEVQSPTGSTSMASITLSGSVDHPGVRKLTRDQTISSALGSHILPTGRQRLTVVLLRRGPEGMVRQIIDVDGNGTPLDERENIALRDGDELIVPDPNQAPAELYHSPNMPGMP